MMRILKMISRFWREKEGNVLEEEPATGLGRLEIPLVPRICVPEAPVYGSQRLETRPDLGAYFLSYSFDLHAALNDIYENSFYMNKRGNETGGMKYALLNTGSPVRLTYSVKGHVGWDKVPLNEACHHDISCVLEIASDTSLDIVRAADVVNYALEVHLLEYWPVSDPIFKVCTKSHNGTKDIQGLPVLNMLGTKPEDAVRVYDNSFQRVGVHEGIDAHVQTRKYHEFSWDERKRMFFPDQDASCKQDTDRYEKYNW